MFARHVISDWIWADLIPIRFFAYADVFPNRSTLQNPSGETSSLSKNRMHHDKQNGSQQVLFLHYSKLNWKSWIQ